MRLTHRLWTALLPLVAFPGTVAAQAIVEAGLGAGRAAITTAPAGGLGKGIGGAFGNLDKALNPGKTAAGSPAAPSRGREQARAVVPILALAYEDPGRVRAGMHYGELMWRFGPPAMEIATEAGAKTLGYTARDGSVQLDVKGGKVVSVEKVTPPQSAVVLPR